MRKGVNIGRESCGSVSTVVPDGIYEFEELDRG